MFDEFVRSNLAVKGPFDTPYRAYEMGGGISDIDAAAIRRKALRGGRSTGADVSSLLKKRPSLSQAHKSQQRSQLLSSLSEKIRNLQPKFDPTMTAAGAGAGALAGGGLGAAMKKTVRTGPGGLFAGKKVSPKRALGGALLGAILGGGAGAAAPPLLKTSRRRIDTDIDIGEARKRLGDTRKLDKGLDLLQGGNRNLRALLATLTSLKNLAGNPGAALRQAGFMPEAVLAGGAAGGLGGAGLGAAAKKQVLMNTQKGLAVTKKVSPGRVVGGALLGALLGGGTGAAAPPLIKVSGRAPLPDNTGEPIDPRKEIAQFNQRYIGYPEGYAESTAKRIESRKRKGFKTYVAAPLFVGQNVRGIVTETPIKTRGWTRLPYSTKHYKPGETLERHSKAVSKTKDALPRLKSRSSITEKIKSLQNVPKARELSKAISGSTKAMREAGISPEMAAAGGAAGGLGGLGLGSAIKGKGRGRRAVLGTLLGAILGGGVGAAAPTIAKNVT